MSPAGKRLFAAIEKAREALDKLHPDAHEYGVLEGMAVDKIANKMRAKIGDHIDPWEVITILCSGTWAASEAADILLFRSNEEKWARREEELTDISDLPF